MRVIQLLTLGKCVVMFLCSASNIVLHRVTQIEISAGDKLLRVWKNENYIGKKERRRERERIHIQKL